MQKWLKPDYAERLSKLTELGRITCVLEACANKLAGSGLHFSASGTPVQQVLHNMAKAVKDYESGQPRPIEQTEAERELEHIGNLLKRCRFYLATANTEVELSRTGRTVQQVLRNLHTRLAVLKGRLPVRVEKLTVDWPPPTSQEEERFLKLGAMLTKVVQEVCREEMYGLLDD